MLSPQAPIPLKTLRALSSCIQDSSMYLILAQDNKSRRINICLSRKLAAGSNHSMMATICNMATMLQFLRHQD
jgi:hypothetical protein